MTTIDVVQDALIVALIIAALVLIRTVGKLHQARKSLGQSQERLALTLHSSGIAVWNWEIPENIVSADESSSVLFGLPSGQFPKTVEGFGALVHPDDRGRIQQEIAATVESGADYNTGFRILRPDGTLRYLAVRAKIYHESGRPQRLTGVCWDMTERRQAEEDLRASNAKLSQSLVELERRKEENGILSEMSDMLQACSSSMEAYDIVTRFCKHLFPTYAGVLYIYNSSRNLVNSVSSWGDPVSSNVAFEPDECWALRRGHPHITNPGQFTTPCHHLEEVPRDGNACFPLMAQGVGLGILYLQTRQAKDAPGQSEFLAADERQLAITIAERVALSLANLHLQEVLKFQSIRDPLTGLYNRRYLEESADRELHRMVRREQPAGLIMMDLDHFKTFNDTFGHEGGDALLRRFGQFLRDHLRKEDIACRYGGEEFCVLFCESSPENTLKRADQLRADMRHLDAQHGGQHLGVVTVSIGVACYPIHGNTIVELIAAADTALYQAKAEGRDRVVTAAMPVPALASVDFVTP